MAEEGAGTPSSRREFERRAAASVLALSSSSSSARGGDEDEASAVLGIMSLAGGRTPSASSSSASSDSSSTTSASPTPADVASATRFLPGSAATDRRRCEPLFCIVAGGWGRSADAAIDGDDDYDTHRAVLEIKERNWGNRWLRERVAEAVRRRRRKRRRPAAGSDDDNSFGGSSSEDGGGVESIVDAVRREAIENGGVFIGTRQRHSDLSLAIPATDDATRREIESVLEGLHDDDERQVGDDAQSERSFEREDGDAVHDRHEPRTKEEHRQQLRRDKSRTDAAPSSALVAIEGIGPFDVLCGRCKDAFNNPGNRRFRSTIGGYLDDYLSLKGKKEKTDLIVSVVRHFRNVLGATFYKPLRASAPVAERRREEQNDGGERRQMYVEICEREAREKVGHALRDLAVSRNRVTMSEWIGGAKP